MYLVTFIGGDVPTVPATFTHLPLCCVIRCR